MQALGSEGTTSSISSRRMPGQPTGSLSGVDPPRRAISWMGYRSDNSCNGWKGWTASTVKETTTWRLRTFDTKTRSLAMQPLPACRPRSYRGIWAEESITQTQYASFHDRVRRRLRV